MFKAFAFLKIFPSTLPLPLAAALYLVPPFITHPTVGAFKSFIHSGPTPSTTLTAELSVLNYLMT